MAALGLQHHRRRAALGQMRQRRMAQLVEGPPSGVTAEQGGGGAVAEPGLAGRGVEVSPGGGVAGAGGGEEQRPAAAACEVTGE